MDFAMWHVGDWISGVEEIQPETEYVYFRLVMFIYQMDGTLKDNDQANARRCRVSTRAYRKHRTKLLDLGKIEIRNGLIWNSRCEREIDHVKKISTRAKTRSEKRWKAHRESKLAEKLAENSLVLSGKTSRKLASKTSENPGKVNDSSKTVHASYHATQMQTRELVNPGPSKVRIEGGGGGARAPARDPVMKTEIAVNGAVDPEAVHERCCELIGVSREKHMAFAASSVVRSWLAGGLDPEIDIYPTVEKLMSGRQGDPPGSMAYFTKAVTRAKVTRMAPLPEVAPERQKEKSPHEKLYESAARVAAMYQSEDEGFTS